VCGFLRGRSMARCLAYGGLVITLMLQEPMHFLYATLHGSFAHDSDGGGNWLMFVMRKTVGGGPGS